MTNSRNFPLALESVSVLRSELDLGANLLLFVSQ